MHAAITCLIVGRVGIEPRRAARIELVGQLRDASTENPSAMAEIGSQLTALNVETEHQEDIHGTLHCP